MTRANQALAVDEPVRDSPAIMRTSIIDDHEPSAPQPRHCHRPGAVPRPDNLSDRDNIQLADVRDGRVIPELVQHLRRDRSHVRDTTDPL